MYTSEGGWSADLTVTRDHRQYCRSSLLLHFTIDLLPHPVNCRQPRWGQVTSGSLLSIINTESSRLLLQRLRSFAYGALQNLIIIDVAPCRIGHNNVAYCTVALPVPRMQSSFL